MSSHKRKRSASVFSSASSQQASFSSSHHHHRLPPDSINPLSHSQSTIKQLTAAGLTQSDLLPSTYIPGFPHRPIRPQHQHQHQHSDDDEEEEAEKTHHGSTTTTNNNKAARARRMRDAQDQQLGILTGVMLRSLAAGDTARAARAFGLARRADVRGKPVDLRRGGLWSLGAEILMRQGGGDEAGSSSSSRRWGSTGNMPRVRAYLEALVLRYPYDRLRPDSVSALDFYPVLFGCEVYDTWAEQRLGLERLEAEADGWSDEDVDMDDDDDDDDEDEEEEEEDGRLPLNGREKRLKMEKAQLGLRSLVRMRGVATSMDALLENAPYSKSAEMLRLRGMVALYIGDLGVAPSPRTRREEQDGRRVREEERDKARILFARMRENGGRVDAYTERWLRDGDADSGDDEDKVRSSLPVFSSLPMR